MKLRLYKDSIRLRLNESDVTTFITDGRIGDGIEFGPGLRLSYGLEASPSVDCVKVRYAPGCLRILLPTQVAKEWALSDVVGIASESGSPSLLIEKDFRCLHLEPGEEDDPNAYPNPLVVDAERNDLLL